MSENKYDDDCFDRKVVQKYAWKDHHAPSFDVLFGLVDDMYRHLKADDQNVVVIHCNSGKGRAGTACCCLLLYSGFFDKIEDCA